MPKWAADLRRLTAYLTYSAFLTKIDLGKVDLDSAVGVEQEVIDASMADGAKKA
jgi:hypothetical protein